MDSNTGRWTKEEHELFLRGLTEFGKDWKQIGSLIKTRTVVQIRTHAQKYFLANKKNEDGSHTLNIPPKQTKEKKRLAPVEVPELKVKIKKRKDIDEGLENLDKIFDLVDAWSSGSDEGTPTSLDELEFLRGPGFPSLGDEKEPINLHLSIPPPTQVTRETLQSFPASGKHALGAPTFGPVGATFLSEPPASDSQEIAASFDPLPPTMEYGFIGRWIDAIPSMNEPL